MTFTSFDSLEALDDAASEWMIREMLAKDKILVSAATGNSPTGAYRKLVEKSARVPVDRLHFVKLDEWYGIDMEAQGSCENYLQVNLLQPLKIPASRYFAFNSQAPSPEKETARVQEWLNTHGPIDICILGVGLNGHIAFNEPRMELDPAVHLGSLAETSLSHAMLSPVKKDLRFGLTLGMKDILLSRKILVILNGRHKAEILEKLMRPMISTDFPASFLWLHPQADCYHCVI